MIDRFKDKSSDPRLVPLSAVVDGHIGAQQNILRSSDELDVTIIDNSGGKGEQRLTRHSYKNMTISVNMDEKRLLRKKNSELIARMMIDNINRHLEEKEQKARGKEPAQDSSPKDGKSSSDTSAKADPTGGGCFPPGR